jgi:hypothetical protein
MGIFASTLRRHFSNVSIDLYFVWSKRANSGAGLKQTIQEDGTWRIRKQEKSPVIEVFKLEEQGHGDILSPAFISWRSASTSTTL